VEFEGWGSVKKRLSATLGTHLHSPHLHASVGSPQRRGSDLKAAGRESKEELEAGQERNVRAEQDGELSNKANDEDRDSTD